MDVIHTQNQLIQALKGLTHIAFVPTMGNLHEGHIKLIQEASKVSRNIVVSIFINPLQFNSKEDFKNYPRTLKEDLSILKELDISFVFAPSEEDILDSLETIEIKLPGIANDLCGKFRPGHFNGVATIVCKLFNLIHPDIAFFGKKDFQQLFLIKALVKQLNYAIEIVGIDRKIEVVVDASIDTTSTPEARAVRKDEAPSDKNLLSGAALLAAELGATVIPEKKKN